jgi:hypothetical protein
MKISSCFAVAAVILISGAAAASPASAAPSALSTTTTTTTTTCADYTKQITAAQQQLKAAGFTFTFPTCQQLGLK